MNNFESFIREKKFLVGISPRTEDWYREVFGWFGIEDPTPEQTKNFVIGMRERNLAAPTCNNRIRALNSFLHWKAAGIDKKCDASCGHLKIPYLKEPEIIPATFTAEQIKAIMRFTPSTDVELRLQTLALFLADTLARITEALTVQWPDVDFDNLLVKLHGKGNKDRLVPFSLTLRKFLIRYQKVTQKRTANHSLVFATRDGLPLTRHNTLRDMKELCRTIGFEPPRRTQHALRHSGAVHYLRKGGSLIHLQKQLGHADLTMVRHYANLTVEDLQAMHPQVSLLN